MTIGAVGKRDRALAINAFATGHSNEKMALTPITVVSGGIREMISSAEIPKYFESSEGPPKLLSGPSPIPSMTLTS
jgi:hypothetical protein